MNILLTAMAAAVLAIGFGLSAAQASGASTPGNLKILGGTDGVTQLTQHRRCRLVCHGQGHNRRCRRVCGRHG